MIKYLDSKNITILDTSVINAVDAEPLKKSLDFVGIFVIFLWLSIFLLNIYATLITK